MSKGDGSSGGGSAGVVVVIVVLLLGVLCCGGIGLFGAGFIFTAIDVSAPAPQPPAVVDSMPPPVELMPIEPVPLEPAIAGEPESQVPSPETQPLTSPVP
jgi:hypothetical protein